MTPEVDDYLAMEAELRPDRVSLFGHCPWDVLRKFYFPSLTTSNGRTKEQNKVTERKTRFSVARLKASYAKNKVRKTYQLPKNRSFKYLFIGAGVRRRKMTDDGVLTDIYCDKLIDELGPNNCRLIERPDGDEGRTPRKHPDCIIDYEVHQSIWVRVVALCYLVLFVPALFRVTKIGLTLEGGPKARSSTLFNFLRNCDAWRVYLQEYFGWKFWLRNSDIQTCFVFCSYGKEAFVAASRNAGIEAVELQHGIISQALYGYSYAGLEKHTAPDVFLTFGKHAIQSQPFEGCHTRVVDLGFPWWEDELYSKRSGAPENASTNVLVVSQPGVGEHLLSEIKRVVSTSSRDLKFYVCPHPRENAETYAQMLSHPDFQDKVFLPGGDIYDVQRKCQYQIGVFSTSLLEGLAAGVSTVILKYNGHELLGYLKEFQGVTFFEPNAWSWSDITEIEESLDRQGYGFSMDWRKNFETFMASKAS